jgi:cytochrome c peroxidase
MTMFLNARLARLLLVPAVILATVVHAHGQASVGEVSVDIQVEGLSEPESQVYLDVSDPQNRVLKVEESEDLEDWTTIGSYKVTNTAMLFEQVPMHPRFFYRFTPDPEGQVTNSISNILDLPETPYDYESILLPPHLQVAEVQDADNTPVTNPITNEGATLGRVLFYDKRLSISNTISCASCHQQDRAFSDRERLSRGFAGGLTGRNSMGLSMARFYARGAFFWDERAATLEEQTTEPIEDAVEMGSQFPDVATELSTEPYYQTLFAEAFPEDPVVDQDNIQRALSQFIRSMVSYESKYDRVQSGTSSFTAEEELGRQLFFNDPLRGPGSINCASCHQTDNFAQPNPLNNGLDLTTTDAGLGAVTGDANDDGKFKVGSLRNIELTAPYMHDGRFNTLEEVIEFYSTDVQAHPNLARQLRLGPGGGPRTPNYTQEEIDALVAFLKTLTDTYFTTSPLWSDPFNYSGVPVSSVTRPDNVLLIILDDWGIDRSPLDNSSPPAQALPNMPHLATLAESGLRFTRAYVNPTCSPTRASIMTGRWAHQTGVYSPGTSDNFSTDEITLPEAFTAAGATHAMALIGKWHLGSGDSGYSTTGGWDEFYGITGGGVGNYLNWTKNVNGATENSTTYTTTDQVNEAIAFIRRSENANDPQPWFCWVALNAPHTPFHDPPAGLAPLIDPGNPALGVAYSTQAAGESTDEWNYRKMLEALDTELGRLLANVPANTNIILIGDNGTPAQVVTEPFSSAHAKGSLYEGGIRVPMVVAGPAVDDTLVNTTTDSVVHAVDLYSSILELASIDPAAVAPPSALSQSKSIVPILDGTDQTSRYLIAEGGDNANRGRVIIPADYPDYKLIIFNDPANPGTPTLEFYNIGAPGNDVNEQSPLDTGSLTGTALEAYNDCIALDTAVGGGFLAP